MRTRKSNLFVAHLKVVFALDVPRDDEKTVGGVWLERCGMGSFDGRLHAPNHLAVGESFHRHRIRVGDEMPERQDVLVGLKSGQRDDFNFGKAAAFVKAKNNRDGQIPPGTHGETALARSMMNPE